MRNKWIPVFDAAMTFAPRFTGLTVAKEAIALGLREGLLQARAEHVTFSDPDYEEEGEEGAVFEAESSKADPLDVPAEIWCRSANWDRDRSSWEWTSGTFEIEGHPSERVEYSYEGLTLLESEVLAIDPMVAPYDTLCQRKKIIQETVDARRGRSTGVRYWDWEPALAELVAIAHYEGLDENSKFPNLFKRGGTASLEKWFVAWFEQNADVSAVPSDRLAPSIPECRIRARLVLGALRGYKLTD